MEGRKREKPVFQVFYLISEILILLNWQAFWIGNLGLKKIQVFHTCIPHTFVWVDVQYRNIATLQRKPGLKDKKAWKSKLTQRPTVRTMDPEAT